MLYKYSEVRYLRHYALSWAPTTYTLYPIYPLPTGKLKQFSFPFESGNDRHIKTHGLSIYLNCQFDDKVIETELDLSLTSKSGESEVQPFASNHGDVANVSQLQSEPTNLPLLPTSSTTTLSFDWLSSSITVLLWNCCSLVNKLISFQYFVNSSFYLIFACWRPDCSARTNR